MVGGASKSVKSTSSNTVVGGPGKGGQGEAVVSARVSQSQSQTSPTTEGEGDEHSGNEESLEEDERSVDGQ